MLTSLIVLLMVAAAPSRGRFVLQPGAFLKLPGATDNYALNTGAATKAAYDPQEHFLYVVGYQADVLHVVDMTDPSSPQLLETKLFDQVNQGLPDAIHVCRGGLNRNYLAVTFESRNLAIKGRVLFFDLLDANTVSGPLTMIRDVVTTDSYDPRSIAWNTDCTQLLVASEGNPHELNGVFEDPPADVEVLIPSFGTSVGRQSIPIVENQVSSAGLRYVFQTCDSGSSTGTSSRLQDLEPTAVHVDSANIAYILFSNNNGIGKLDLTNPTAEIAYYSLGRKDWSQHEFDGAFDDNGINLQSRTIQSFYQPKAMVSFEVDGKTWLATADTGNIRRVALSTCRFDESTVARSWQQPFSDGLTPQEVATLQAEMNNFAEIGRLRVSKLRATTDGWDPLFQGFDFVCTFGGRGFSILDPEDMSRVYDSGDDFERYFIDNATEAEKAVFNGNVGNSGQPISSQFDRRSPEMGPMPSAIAATDFNGTQVLVIANGMVGGLYTYSVSPGPMVNFEGFTRRGQPGLSWNEAYARNDDAIGEPYITDLMIIEDQGQKTVVAVSSYAGALSFYSVQEEV